MKKRDIAPLDTVNLERIASPASGPVLGEWYWVLPDKKKKLAAPDADDTDEPEEDDEKNAWLGCAVRLGSNYVKLRSPGSNRWHVIRVHFEDFWTMLRHEPDAAAYIHKRIAGAQENAQQLLGQVQELTARLGMQRQEAVTDGSTALVALSGATDVKLYGKQLVLAKEKQLPELFKAIEEAHEELADWMKAPSLPMIAQLEKTKDSIGDIDDRIFSINLYAGLTEEVVKCCGGKRAAMTDKLHVMQRMLFMDEESLLGYKHGGMTFNDIKAFDAFMCEPENRDRILPFPRTLVAMRVRRYTKGRDWDGSLRSALINFSLEQADKWTFLYIRNGEQVWRLSCDMDFGELIFPDRTAFNLQEPKMFNHSRRTFISVHDYELRMEAERVRAKNEAAWRKKNGKKDDWMRNPYRDSWAAHDLCDFAPLDPTNVYYDEGMAIIDKQVKEYNRVALIIQGLFDRSQVLHPHPPVKSWTAEGFDAAITLVNDGTGVLNYGEPPSFEEYRERCNASLEVGSVTTGQQDFWQRHEAKKENARRDRDYRVKSEHRPTHYRPYGNPGPVEPSRVEVFSPTRGALFKWTRERMVPGRISGSAWGSLNYEDIECSIRVPVAALFNISAYQPGDFKQFFRDPRTRAQYLEWAPMLLVAEEYVAKHPNPPRKVPWFEMFNQPSVKS